MDLLDDLYSRHPVVHLLFSGGKDSTLCLMRILKNPDFAKRTVIVTIDTGDRPLAIRKFIDEFEDKVFRLDVVYSNVREWVQQNGFPSDVVPVDNTHMGRIFLKKKEGVKVCSRIDCCNANIWTPLREYLAVNAVSAVVVGERDSDPRGTRPHEWLAGSNVIEVCRPIALLSDEEVRAELSSYEMLQARFTMEDSSIDCECCTAYWESLNRRLDYIRTYNPEKAKCLGAVVNSIHETIFNNINQCKEDV